MSLRSRSRQRILAGGFAVFYFAHSAICRAQDNPEPGPPGARLPGLKPNTILAKPYTKGVRVIGHQPIGGRVGNQQLVWVDHCAYVGGFPSYRGNDYDGVAVIDVMDPSSPKLVGVLHDRGALRAAETLDAVDLPGRRVLAAGDYAGGNPQFGPNEPPTLDLYDVSDCTKPRLISEFIWPENVHTLTFSPDGRRLYAPSVTQPPFGTGGIHVLDVADLAHPRYMGRFKVTAPDGKAWDFGSHEFVFSPDERRIYAGVPASLGGDLNGGKLIPLQEGGGNEVGGIYIIDNSDIAAGRPGPKLRLIGTAQRAGWHSVVRARINGVPYLVGAAESGSCPGAFPRITSIADETKPVLVGEFRLFLNKPENYDSTMGRGAPVSSHFADVDNPINTRLGLFNFLGSAAAGFRIADLRDPSKPVEIGYFRPGDGCTGHVRFVPETDQMWVLCSSSGFWVLQLWPELRAAFHRP